MSKNICRRIAQSNPPSSSSIASSRTTATLGVYGGVEAERASGVPQPGHRFVGVTAAANFEIRSDLSGFVNVAVEDRDYRGTDPFFLVARNDTFYRAGGGIVYEFARHWHLIPQVYYNRNVDLDEYDRPVMSLTLRRDFE